MSARTRSMHRRWSVEVVVGEHGIEVGERCEARRRSGRRRLRRGCARRTAPSRSTCRCRATRRWRPRPARRSVASAQAVSAGSISSRSRRHGVSVSSGSSGIADAPPVGPRQSTCGRRRPTRRRAPPSIAPRRARPCRRRRRRRSRARVVAGASVGSSWPRMRSRNAVGETRVRDRGRGRGRSCGRRRCGARRRAAARARPVGRSSPTGTVAGAVCDRRASTFAPTPSIQAVPRGARDAGDHDRRTPVGGRALHHARAARLRVSKCTTKPSSAGARAVADVRRATRSTPANSPSVTRSWSITCEPCAPNQPPPLASSAHHAGHLGARVGEHGNVQQHRREARFADRARPDGAGERGLAGIPAELGAEQVHDARGFAPPRAPCGPSAASRANGFSQITCLPAAIAASASSAWVCGGVAIVTASTPSSASASSSRSERERNVELPGALHACGRGRARPRPCTSKPAARSARTWVMQPNPVPTTTTPERRRTRSGAVTFRAASFRRRRRSRRARACWRSSRTGGVSVGSPRSTAAQNASSWYS